MECDNYFEYVIWGKPPDSDQDTLLMALYDNKPITDKQIAHEMQLTLERHYGCTDTRIHTLDFVTLPWNSGKVRKMINL
jgi:hypothetical protein